VIIGIITAGSAEHQTLRRERGGQRSLLWLRERVRTWRPVVKESQLVKDRRVPGA
jgi:hypothetical protein